MKLAVHYTLSRKFSRIRCVLLLCPYWLGWLSRTSRWEDSFNTSGVSSWRWARDLSKLQSISCPISKSKVSVSNVVLYRFIFQASSCFSCSIGLNLEKGAWFQNTYGSSPGTIQGSIISWHKLSPYSKWESQGSMLMLNPSMNIKKSCPYEWLR